MTDQEWMAMMVAVKQRYLAEGRPEAKVRALTQEYMRQVRLDIARASFARAEKTDEGAR